MSRQLTEKYAKAQEQQRRWYMRNAEKKRAFARDYYAKNREGRIEASRRYRAERPGVWRESHRKRLYGITSADFDALILKQNNQCAICGITFDDSTKKLTPHIDHDHKTGRVRGVLCSSCNASLGHVEKEGFLAKAIEYLGER